MDRIQEIDKMIAELYNQLHEAVDYYADEREAMMEPVQPYASIDSIAEKIADLKVERVKQFNFLEDADCQV